MQLLQAVYRLCMHVNDDCVGDVSFSQGCSAAVPYPFLLERPSVLERQASPCTSVINSPYISRIFNLILALKGQPKSTCRPISLFRVNEAHSAGLGLTCIPSGCALRSSVACSAHADPVTTCMRARSGARNEHAISLTHDLSAGYVD